MQITFDRFAAMNVQYAQFSFDYFLESMDSCGIRNIEMWPAEPHFFHYDHTSSLAAARTIRELRKKIEDRGMQVVMYTPETLAYPFNPAGGDLERMRAIDMFKLAMDDALEFGTSNVFLNPGCGLRDESVEAAWSRAVDTFQRITDYGKSFGIQFHMEQLQPYESNLVTTAADLARMIDDVGTDNLTANLDIGAMAEAGDAIEDYFELLPGRVSHIHFSDRNHETLGDRHLPLDAYLEALAAHEFAGYLSLEINDGMYLMEPHPPFMCSADWLRAHLPVGS